MRLRESIEPYYRKSGGYGIKRRLPGAEVPESFAYSISCPRRIKYLTERLRSSKYLSTEMVLMHSTKYSSGIVPLCRMLEFLSVLGVSAIFEQDVQKRHIRATDGAYMPVAFVLYLVEIRTLRNSYIRNREQCRNYILCVRPQH